MQKASSRWRKTQTLMCTNWIRAHSWDQSTQSTESTFSSLFSLLATLNGVRSEMAIEIEKILSVFG